MSLTKAMGPFRDSHGPSLGSPGPGPMYRLNPSIIGSALGRYSVLLSRDLVTPYGMMLY